jgi:hypothetical protein
VQAVARESQLSVVAAQGLRWLLDDLLDAEQDLLALLATPTGVPAEQRERLAGFCTTVGQLVVARGAGAQDVWGERAGLGTPFAGLGLP